MRKRRLEEQLLIYCATARMDKNKSDKVRELLSQDLDWDYILKNSVFASSTPLLFYNLKRLDGTSSIPESVTSRLRSRYAEVLRANTNIYRQLQEILQKLQHEGICTILLKGISLAETVYPDIALRPMSDIDILVRKSDLRAVNDVLTQLGYYQSRSAEDYKDHHHVAPYGRKTDGKRGFSPVEIHYNIAPEPFMSMIDVESLWKDLQTINIKGIDVYILSPENLILHLCFHLAGDSFLRGIWVLTDISEAVKYYDKNLDWDLIVRRSREYGLSRAVYYPLSLAEGVMELDIPAHVFGDLNPRSELSFFEAKLLKTILWRNFWKGKRARQSSPDFLDTAHSFVNAARKLLCMELLCTSGIDNRIGNLLVRIPKKAFRKYAEKGYVLGKLR